MGAPSPAVQPGRFGAKDGRLSTGSQAMGGPAGCGDLGPRGRTTQVADDGAAYAYGLLLGQGSSEDVTPLTGTTPAHGRTSVSVCRPGAEPRRPVEGVCERCRVPRRSVPRLR
jgi:hypothetical protein